MSWKGDPNAVHTVVDGEIAGLTEKASPVDADLVLIEDSADSNSKKKAKLGNLPGGGGGGGGGDVPGWISYLTTRQADETSHVADDFFDDASLDAAWTTLTVSGAQTITEKYGKLSVVVNSTISSGDYNAILQSVTPSVGDVIETRLRFMTNNNNFVAGGLVWADGDTASDNMCSVEVSRQPGTYGTDLRHLSRGGTFTNYGAAIGVAGELETLDHIYLRIEYDASNTFRIFLSLDGVSWIDQGTVSDTLTPTHVGLFWTVFGNTGTQRTISFDYFRYNS